jgi:hypothetical protein
MKHLAIPCRNSDCAKGERLNFAALRGVNEQYNQYAFPLFNHHKEGA